MSENAKCRIRNCRNFSDPRSKSCADCKEKGRRRTAKYRAKRADNDREDLEVLGLNKVGRGPNRPKPPLFRIRLPDKSIMLCTRRDWEYLDETYFQDELDTEFSPSSRKEEVELIPIKICIRWWCYQPLPASHPKTTCGHCSQRSSQSTDDRNSVKKEKNCVDQTVSSLASEDFEIRSVAAKYLRRKIPKDGYTLISSDAVTVLIKLLDDREKGMSNLALAILSSCRPWKHKTEIGASLTKLLQLLHDTEADHASLLRLLECVAGDGAYSDEIYRSLSRIIELAEDYPYQVFSVLAPFSCTRSYCGEIGAVIARFAEILIARKNKGQYPDLVYAFFEIFSVETYHADIVRILPTLIDHLCDSSARSSYVYYAAPAFFKLTVNGSYRKEIAAAIAKINEVLLFVGGDGDKLRLLKVLSELSDDETYHDDIAPSLPTLMDLLPNTVTAEILRILCNFSRNANYRQLVSPALPAVVDAVSGGRIKPWHVDFPLRFIMDDSSDPLNTSVIEPAIPQIVQWLGIYSAGARGSAFVTLRKLHQQNMYHTSIYNAIPEIVRFASQQYGSEFGKCFLEELSKNEMYHARISALTSHRD